METVSVKWPSGSDASWACFTLAWAYGWGCGRVGSSSNEGGSVESDQPGCYCMFCLVSHPCAGETERWAASGSCAVPLCVRGSPRTTAREWDSLPFLSSFMPFESNRKVVMVHFSVQLRWSWPWAQFDLCFLLLFEFYTTEHLRWLIELRLPLSTAKWVCTCPQLSTKVRCNLVTQWCSLHKCLPAASLREILFLFSGIKVVV